MLATSIECGKAHYGVFFLYPSLKRRFKIVNDRLSSCSPLFHPCLIALPAVGRTDAWRSMSPGGVMANQMSTFSH